MAENPHLRLWRKPQLIFAATGAAIQTLIMLVPTWSRVLESENVVTQIFLTVYTPGFIVGVFFQALAGGSLHGGGKMWVFIVFSTIGNAAFLYAAALLFTELVHKLRDR